MTTLKKESNSSATGGTQPLLAAPARVRSETLLGRTGVLIIEHAGREYRLRQTSTGKLILTA